MMGTEMTVLTAATAMAAVIIEPENLSRIDGLPLPGGVLPQRNSHETKQADGSVFQYSPIAIELAVDESPANLSQAGFPWRRELPAPGRTTCVGLADVSAGRGTRSFFSQGPKQAPWLGAGFPPG